MEVVHGNMKPSKSHEEKSVGYVSCACTSIVSELHIEFIFKSWSPPDAC